MACINAETQRNIDLLLTSPLHTPTTELFNKCKQDDVWVQNALSKQSVNSLDVNLVLHVLQYNKSNYNTAVGLLGEWIARANEE